MKYLLFFLIPFFAFAQENPPTIDAQKTSETIVIDGILNENSWHNAVPFDNFKQIEPNQSDSISAKTSVKVLYDTKSIYISIVSDEPLGKKVIRATDFKRDFTTQQHDFVAIALDVFNDKRNAVVFAVNPFGVQRDYLSFDDKFYDVDWDAVWNVKTKINEGNWVAEIEIPWKTLRYKFMENEKQEFGINIFRTRRIKGEFQALSPYPRSFTFTRMEFAGILKNLELPKPSKTNIRLNPYLLYSTDFKDKNEIKYGGELKYAISANDVLDVTINTDFAQADVDKKVNNLSRFSLFFPEKRSFFLENSSLFNAGINPMSIDNGGSIGIQPFFSRKIGLNENGEALDLPFGARFVHRSVKSNYGGLYVRQHGNGENTDFAVLRFSQNLGEQNRIGSLLTFKNSYLSTNFVGAVDGFFRLDKNQTVSSLFSFSNSTNQDAGFAGYGQYYYTSNQFKFWLTESVIDKNYDPEVGFVSRKNILATTPGLNWFYRGKLLPFKSFIRGFYPGMAMELYHDLKDFSVSERQFFINPIWLSFHNGGSFGYSILPTFQNLSEDFSPVGLEIKKGKYDYLQHQILFASDPSKFISAMGNLTWGSYYDGNLTSQTYSVKYAPIPHISFLGEFNRNHFKNVGNVTEKTVDLYALNLRLALNPNVQFVGNYQFSSENRQKNINLRFSWQYHPLSYITVVYNSRKFQDFTNGQTFEIFTKGLLFKVNYIWQF